MNCDYTWEHVNICMSRFRSNKRQEFWRIFQKNIIAFYQLLSITNQTLEQLPDMIAVILHEMVNGFKAGLKA